MTGYALGIDAGRTKTLAVVVDWSGRVLGHGAGGPDNWGAVGLDRAACSLSDAVHQAITAAQLRLPSVGSAFAGVAGVVTDGDRQLARGLLAPVLAGARLEVDHDCRGGAGRASWRT
ncbi:MAG: hypothetical protein LBJ62_08070 [Bifidobacteriaceae bacterium]|nr:hypothetical protein [Bifidobacteriaceae bacterium]